MQSGWSCPAQSQTYALMTSRQYKHASTLCPCRPMHSRLQKPKRGWPATPAPRELQLRSALVRQRQAVMLGPRRQALIVKSRLRELWRYIERFRVVSSHGKGGPANLSEPCCCCGLSAALATNIRAEGHLSLPAGSVPAKDPPLQSATMHNRVLISSRRQHKTSSLQPLSCLVECSKQLADSHT